MSFFLHHSFLFFSPPPYLDLPYRLTALLLKKGSIHSRSKRTSRKRIFSSTTGHPATTAGRSSASGHSNDHRVSIVCFIFVLNRRSRGCEDRHSQRRTRRHSNRFAADGWTIGHGSCGRACDRRERTRRKDARDRRKRRRKWFRSDEILGVGVFVLRFQPLQRCRRRRGGSRSSGGSQGWTQDE